MLAQTVGFLAPSELTVKMLRTFITRLAHELIDKQIKAIQAFNFKIVQNIPDKLAFVDEDDDDMMIVGEVSNYGSFHFDDKLAFTIPFLGALVSESREGKEVMASLMNQEELNFKEVEKLKLLPIPQMKGIEPIRAKTKYHLITSLLGKLIRSFKESSDQSKKD